MYGADHMTGRDVSAGRHVRQWCGVVPWLRELDVMTYYNQWQGKKRLHTL